MAIYDSNLLLINTAITQTTTGSWKDLGAGGSPVTGNTIRLEVPQASGTSPTMDVEYQFSDDASAIKEKITLPQITAAGSHLTRFAIKRRYVRAKLTIGGTNPNFGTVVAGIEGGDYNANR